MGRKGKGIWILVGLAASIAVSGLAMKWVHAGTPGHALAAKAEAVLESAKGSGIHWKSLFIFLVIAIPSIAILTRVIAWLCGRKKGVLSHGVKLLGDLRTAREVASAQELEARIEGIEWVEPKVGKPYATYEEYMNDLKGTVDLDEFLARCRAGVPKDPKKAALDIAKMQSARERLAAVKERIDRKAAHDRIWDEGAENLQRLMEEEARKVAAGILKSFPNAAVPVVSGGAGGDGSGGVRVTGIGSPPPAHEQPQLPKTCSECNGVGTHLFLPCTGQWMLNVPR